ncbi:DNA-binding anti-repressor SinI [Cytobacillus purgationiresistens]|uniref:Sin domain-containing protein n=1 Tax=Cytobacillus purgationiresistens TaxID=863449 RepID=A0ABU0AG07_9BACI|nr:DNA-binding anti-repressor SinI [Cytobacillus purgationiresistens]MDQ0269343.1 hypothetical protein [Cytobacillus purgationiresistens]
MKNTSENIRDIEDVQYFEEWLLLIAEAKEIGLTTDEVRLFFKNYQNSKILNAKLIT